MPIVHVHIWPGRDEEKKRKIIAGITQVFEDIDIPAEAVRVLLHEVPREHWGVAGVPAADLTE